MRLFGVGTFTIAMGFKPIAMVKVLKAIVRQLVFYNIFLLTSVYTLSTAQ